MKNTMMLATAMILTGATAWGDAPKIGDAGAVKPAVVKRAIADGAVNKEAGEQYLRAVEAIAEPSAAVIKVAAGQSLRKCITDGRTDQFFCTQNEKMGVCGLGCHWETKKCITDGRTEQFFCTQNEKMGVCGMGCHWEIKKG